MSAESAWSENQREIQELKSEIARLKSRITELCDALDGYGIKPWYQYKELIQHAREDAR